MSKQKPSRTAYGAAWHRACTNMDYPGQKWGPDYLAEKFLPFPMNFFTKSRKFREMGKEKLKKFTPGLHEYIIARTLFIDEVFAQALEESFSQIIFLGAGYDSRGIRFNHLNKGTRIIELDMAAIQNRKIKCLKKKKIDVPECLTFAPIDFEKQSLESALTSAGYEKEKRTLFIWEGVTMYLEARSVKETLTFIQESSTSDSLLAFDIVVSFTDEEAANYHGAREIREYMRERHKDEPIKFSLEGKNIAEFLAECGHKIVRHLDQNQMEAAYLMREEGTSIGKPNGVFNLIITSPEV